MAFTYIHRECIQENFQLMAYNMSLQSTLLLDELVAADIRGLKNRKDRNRKLVVTISKRSRKKI
jgi:hypothetical protein